MTVRKLPWYIALASAPLTPLAMAEPEAPLTGNAPTVIAAVNTPAATAQSVAAVRNELEQLKRMNHQLLQRIQLLENKLTKTQGQQYAAAQTTQSDASSDQPGQAQSAAAAEAQNPESSKRKKEPDKSRGVDDLVMEAHTLFDQTWSTEIGYEYTHFDRSQLILNGFLALDAIFLGTISIDEVESDIFKTSVVNRWGVTPKLQFNMEVPYLYRKTRIVSGGFELGATNRFEADVTDSGIGDVSLGMSYQLFNETRNRPDTVFNLSVSAPTGKDPYGINLIDVNPDGNLRIPEELPTGTGLWGATAGVSFLKTSDPALFFANFSYTHYFEEEFDDLGTRLGLPPQPGSVELGDQFQLGLGIAFAINERTSMSMWYTQRYFMQAETSLGKIPGSETSTGMFDIGVTYALTDRLSVVTDLGIGLTQDSSDYKFSVRFPYRF